MIRKAGENDVGQILHVINYTNQLFYSEIIPKKYFKEPVLSRTELELLLEKQQFYVYETNDVVIGVASLERISEIDGMVHWVYVLPEYEKRGVGTSLMNAMEREAKRTGLKTLTLFANAQAHWAIAFYKKLGYETAGNRERLCGEDVIFKKTVGRLRNVSK